MDKLNIKDIIINKLFMKQISIILFVHVFYYEEKLRHLYLFPQSVIVLNNTFFFLKEGVR